MKLSKNLNPWFVTGLTDGDGNFALRLVRTTTGIGWGIALSYSVVAANNLANQLMLDQLKIFFGGLGSITVNSSDNTISYSVFGLKNCLIIREHFNCYPLMTYKLVYFLLWSAIIELMVKKMHLTLKGLLQIIAFKAHFKMGLSNMLKEAFSNFTPVKVFAYAPNLALMNIHWVAGFINADGSFSVLIRKANDTTLGEKVSIEINISQHEKSLLALNHLAEFLGCGSVKQYGQTAYRWRVSNIKDVNRLITTFKEKEVQILGAKALDFADFCKAVEIINSKAHLTRVGLETIRTLSNGMNSTRTDFGSC